MGASQYFCSVKDHRRLPIWNTTNAAIQAITSWNTTIPRVHFQDCVSRLIVAIVAIHGVWRRQNTISAYALTAVNPVPPRIPESSAIPAAELMFVIP